MYRLSVHGKFPAWSKYPIDALAGRQRAGFPQVAACMTCPISAARGHPALETLAALPKTQTIVLSAPAYRLPDDIWTQDRIRPAMEMS